MASAEHAASGTLVGGFVRAVGQAPQHERGLSHRVDRGRSGVVLDIRC